MKPQLGTVQLSSDILDKAKTGLWAMEFDKGKEPRLYGDETMLGLLCVTDNLTPEETYRAWYERVDKDAYGLIAEYVDKMTSGEHAEVRYPWHRPDGSVMTIRCGGLRNRSYSEGVRLEGTHQDVTKIHYLNAGEEGLKRQKEITARLFALNDELESLYDVDLETGEYDLNIEGRTFYSEVSTKLVEHKEFFEDTKKNVELVIHPDDRQSFLKICNKEAIRKVLTNKPFLDWYYRISVEGTLVWFKMRIVYKDETRRNVIIGVFNAEKEMAAREVEKQAAINAQAAKEARQAIESFTKNFTTVYRVDLKDGKYSTLKFDGEESRANFHISDDFHTNLMFYVDEHVYDSDKEMMRREFDFSVIREKLKKEPVYSVEYRENVGVIPKWHEMKVSAMGDDEVMIGYIEADERILTDHIRQLIEDNYNGLYVLNLKAGLVRVLKTDGHMFKENTTIPYQDMVEQFVYELSEESKEMFEIYSDPKREQEILKNDGKNEFTYLSTHYGDQPVWMKAETLILSWNDGVPETAVTLISKCDKQQREKMRLDQQIREQNRQLEAQREQLEQTLAIAHYFLKTFVSAYYLDLRDASYVVLQRTGDLDQRYPRADNLIASLEKYMSTDVHPEDRERVRAYFDFDTVRVRIQKEGSCSVIFRDISGGKEKYYRFLAIPGADSDHVGFGFTDITDNVNKDNELVAANRSLKLLTGSTRELYPLIMVLNLTQNYYNMLEYDNFTTREASERGTVDELIEVGTSTIPDEPLKKAFHDLYNREAAMEAFRSGKRILALKHTQRGDDGVTHWIQTTSVLTEFEGDIMAVTFARPIDEEVAVERKIQEKLQNALDKAEAASKAKTAFLFNMSHDIRTPMNAIIGYTAMAKKHTGETEKVCDFLEKIEVSGNQLIMLVNQILEMSRIESGKIVLNEQSTDVIEKSYALQTMTDADVANKGLKYNIDIKNVAHRRAFVDVTRMNQILINIVGNAVKYTPEGGSVTFTLEEHPSDKDGYGLYTFTVVDTGIGMSKEFLEHIFDEFSRENTTTVSHIPGTGLGMSIVKKLVDLMNGTIEVKSQKDIGTTVVVTVPLRWDMSQPVAEEAAAEEMEPVSIKGKKILLVEDNEMNREIATDILQESGVIVDAVEDGTFAVEKMKAAKKGDYDLILMDIQMPQMNGYEATKCIRALTNGVQDIPIIAMTANAFEEDRKNALEAGMNEHLAKPVDINKLKVTIAKFV